MIDGKNITLRGLELSDVDELMKHWNDLELRQFLGDIAPNSKEEEIEWIKSTWKERKEKIGYTFAIELKSKKLLIGSVGVREIDWHSRSGELAISLYNKNYWNKGYGTEAVKMILDYAFKWLNLNSVWLRVWSYNKRAISCYEKTGFRKTGKLRNRRYLDGKYHDNIFMDMLASEWK